MDMEKVLVNLQAVKQENEKFLGEYEKKVLRLARDESMTAEESLEQEMLFEIIDKMKRINQVIGYWSRKPEIEGILSRDMDGRICLNGIPIQPMEEFEVLVYDEILNQKIWTRTYVSFSLNGEKQWLAGFEKDMDVNGIRTRFRNTLETPWRV